MIWYRTAWAWIPAQQKPKVDDTKRICRTFVNPADELVGEIGNEEMKYLAAVVHVGGMVVTLDKINI